VAILSSHLHFILQTGVYMSQHQCPAPIKCGSPGWGRLYLGLDDGSLVTFDIQVSSLITLTQLTSMGLCWDSWCMDIVSYLWILHPKFWNKDICRLWLLEVLSVINVYEIWLFMASIYFVYFLLYLINIFLYFLLYLIL